jgi:hypothetical protein
MLQSLFCEVCPGLAQTFRHVDFEYFKPLEMEIGTKTRRLAWPLHKDSACRVIGRGHANGYNYGAMSRSWVAHPLWAKPGTFMRHGLGLQAQTQTAFSLEFQGKRTIVSDGQRINTGLWLGV